MIDGERRTRHYVRIVYIGGDADNAAGRTADIDEFDDRIGPHHVVIERILSGKHALRDALADDDDGLAAAAVGVVEIAAGDHRNSERSEETGRDGAEAGARVFLAGSAHVAVSRKLQPERGITRIAPGNIRSDGYVIDTRQLLNAPYYLFVEADNLISACVRTP